MDPYLIVSPHLDDAVLSCGQLLAGRPEGVVATLFAGTPPKAERIQTTYDRDCGFPSARRAMIVRAAEDHKALTFLRASAHRLGFLDHQYRGDVPVDEEAAVLELAALVDATPNLVQVFGPVGLAHPDHVSAARIFMDLLTVRPHLEGWVYEELPSRVLWPEQVEPALGWWRRYYPAMELRFAGTGPVESKATALGCYRSQLWALDRHAIYCPERHWILNP